VLLSNAGLYRNDYLHNDGIQFRVSIRSILLFLLQFTCICYI
jgi:hypothetical protein